MKRVAIGAGLLALSLTGSPGAVQAADLDFRYEKQTQPYEPYAPYYYHREGRRVEEWRSTEPYEPAPPPRYSYKEPSYQNDYWNPDARRIPYEKRVPSYAPNYAERCVVRGEVRHKLKEHGWQDFRDLELRPDTASVTARRPDGLVYRLTVDRCTGVILSAQLLDDGRGWRQRNYSSRIPY